MKLQVSTLSIDTSQPVNLEPTHTYWCGSLVNRPYQHWLHPVVKLEIKMPPTSRSRSLVMHTSKCGHASSSVSSFHNVLNKITQKWRHESSQNLDFLFILILTLQNEWSQFLCSSLKQVAFNLRKMAAILTLGCGSCHKLDISAAEDELQLHMFASFLNSSAQIVS